MRGKQTSPVRDWSTYPQELLKVLQLASDLGWTSRPMARIPARTIQSRLQKMCMAIRRSAPTATPADLRASAQSVVWRILGPDDASLSPKALFALPADVQVRVNGCRLDLTPELEAIRADLEAAEGETWPDSIYSMARAWREDQERAAELARRRKE